jgi:hypothetical protein
MHTRTLAILILLLLASANASAQTEQFVPYQPTAEQTQVRVWTSGQNTFARVTLTFPSSGFRAVGSGLARQGNNISGEINFERWTGAVLTVITYHEQVFNLGPIGAETGTYTFTFRSRGVPVKSVTFVPAAVAERWEETSLTQNQVYFAVYTVGNATFARVTLLFPDASYRVASWGPLVRTGNDFTSAIRLERSTAQAGSGRPSSDYRLFSLGELDLQGTYTVSVQFSDGVRHTSAPFTPERQRVGGNLSDEPAFFVRQQYLDFLGREPDDDGLNFWYRELTAPCTPFTPDCTLIKRENVSAAFFYSIEHQQTGFLVHRLYKAAYGRMAVLDEFRPDTRRISKDVVVGRQGWEALIEANKRQYIDELVARADFRALHPDTLTPEQYVEALNRNAAHVWSELEGGPLSQAERQALADGLRQGTETRATVLRKVAEHPNLRQQEFTRAFVLMQYFGYLQRNPNAAPDTDWSGFNFWLSKLNTHHGDYRAAEMVKSFIISGEYRNRFRQ